MANINGIKQNPILILADRAQTAEISWKEAFEIGRSVEFLETVEKRHIDEIGRLTRSIMDQNLQQALQLSYLNLICAEKKKLDPLSEAATNLFHGLLLKRQGNLESSFEFIETARNLFRKIGATNQAVECELQLGEMLAHLGKPEQSLDLFESARNFFADNSLETKVGICDYNIGLVFAGIEKYEQAINAILSAKDIFIKKDMVGDAAGCSYVIAEICVNIGKNEDAIKNYISAKEGFDGSDTEPRCLDCNLKIAGLYNESGDYQKALPFLVSAKSIALTSGQDDVAASCDLRIAELSELSGNNEKALEYLLSARRRYSNLNADFDVAKCKYISATILQKINRHADAIESLKSAKKIYASHGTDTDVAKCNFHIGLSLAAEENVREAIKYYTIAAATYEKEDREVELAKCDSNMARMYEALDQDNKALYLYQAAKKLFEKQGMGGDVGKLDLDIANIYVKLSQYDKALKLYESARKLFEKQGMADEVARCDNNIANVYIQVGQQDKALKLLKSAKSIFHEEGMDGESAICDASAGNIFENLGQYDKALESYQSARTIFEKESMEGEVIRCDLHIANIHKELGHDDQALALLSSIDLGKFQVNMTRLYEGLAQEDIESDFVTKNLAKWGMSRADMHKEFGQYQKALDYYQIARNIFGIKGEELEVAKCDASTGNIYENLGQYEKSIDFLHSARRVFEKKEDEINIARSDFNLAVVYERLRDYKKAVDLLQKAKYFFHAKGMTVELAKCDLNLAGIYEAVGNNDKVLDLYKSARNIFEENSFEADVAKCDHNIALFISEQAEQRDKALDLLSSARDIFEKLGQDVDVARCDANMGKIYERLGQHDKGMRSYQKAYNSFGNLPEFGWRLLSGMAKSHKAQGEEEKARRSYEKAIKVIEDIRYSFLQEKHRVAFFESVYNVYYEMVTLCLEQEDFKSAIEYIERLKTRNLADLLAHRDLMPKNATEEQQRRYQELRLQMRSLAYKMNREKNSTDLIDLKKESDMKEKRHEKMVAAFKEKDPNFDPDQRIMISFPEIVGLLEDDDTAIVELFPMKDKTVVFVLQRGKNIEKSVVCIPDYSMHDLAHDIGGLIERYVAFRQEKDPQRQKTASKDWEKYIEERLTNLYDKIFARIKEHLRLGSRIIVIPYSGFHLLPLHAMYTENNGSRRYVIDDYTVVYAPSAKILKQAKQRERNQNGTVLVAFSNPKDTTKLHYSPNEVDEIVKLFADSRPIFRATREDILKNAKESRIFHYSGHATLDRLILHDEKSDGDRKKEFLIDDIFSHLDLPFAYLATLSACETGMTKLGHADEYIGLPSAFLYAGAPTVISSLWSVNDKSTTLLMRKMYEFIKEGQGKVEALREAQLWLKDPSKRKEHLEMLSDTDDIHWVGTQPPDENISDFSKPYHWAGFICSGVD